jgi:methionyl aminopeptidase
MKAPEIVSAVLELLAKRAEPGVSTFDLNAIADTEIQKLGGVSFNKGYKPDWNEKIYPYATCISVNTVIAHGLPSHYKLQDGDLVNFDLGVIDTDGNVGDSALTVGVGAIDDKDEKLLHYAKKALYAGIERVRHGVQVAEIARAIESTAGYGGFIVNRSMIGHGIGHGKMHQEPWIMHTSNFMPEQQDKAEHDRLQKILDTTLIAGQVICIEPMLTYQDAYGQFGIDGWSLTTRDGGKSAMFEHMIKVTALGYEILTTHISPFVNPFVKRKIITNGSMVRN